MRVISRPECRDGSIYDQASAIHEARYIFCYIVTRAFYMRDGVLPATPRTLLIY